MFMYMILLLYDSVEVLLYDMQPKPLIAATHGSSRDPDIIDGNCSQRIPCIIRSTGRYLSHHGYNYNHVSHHVPDSLISLL